MLFTRARIIEGSNRIVGMNIARENNLKIVAKYVDIVLYIIKIAASTEGKAFCITHQNRAYHYDTSNHF